MAEGQGPDVHLGPAAGIGPPQHVGGRITHPRGRRLAEDLQGRGQAGHSGRRKTDLPAGVRRACRRRGAHGHDAILVALDPGLRVRGAPLSGNLLRLAGELRGHPDQRHGRGRRVAAVGEAGNRSSRGRVRHLESQPAHDRVPSGPAHAQQQREIPRLVVPGEKRLLELLPAAQGIPRHRRQAFGFPGPGGARPVHAAVLHSRARIPRTAGRLEAVSHFGHAHGVSGREGRDELTGLRAAARVPAVDIDESGDLQVGGDLRALGREVGPHQRAGGAQLPGGRLAAHHEAPRRGRGGGDRRGLSSHSRRVAGRAERKPRHLHSRGSGRVAGAIHGQPPRAVDRQLVVDLVEQLVEGDLAVVDHGRAGRGLGPARPHGVGALGKGGQGLLLALGGKLGGRNEAGPGDLVPDLHARFDEQQVLVVAGGVRLDLRALSLGEREQGVDQGEPVLVPVPPPVP